MANHRRQRYRAEWENDIQFRDWLRPFEGDEYRAYCVYCERDFWATPRNCEIHAESERHIGIVNDMNGVIDEDQRIGAKVNAAIIKLTAVFTEHYLAFFLANHLITVVKDISADDDCQKIW
ncbi:hypothetical protein TKK_0002286 [Trichogramma kaykai]|uniref:Uncharacterized protein n=1 Tax=Trichogramma kaykai TaxID=54128 RepID=A0ABD2XD56_9HYME